MAYLSMMPKFIAPLFLACFFLSVGVQAGHPLWEYSGREAAAANATQPIAKRWMTIPQYPDDANLWPGKTIRYCYRNDESKQLAEFIEAGMNLWYAMGLGMDFRLKEVSLEEQRDDPLNVLLVTLTQRTLRTSPGLSRTRRPEMSLTINPNIGMLHVTANIAHELGHAWGLLHEHQNPAFWSTKYTGNSAPEKSLFKFNCENLADFADKTSGLSEDEIWGPDGVCVDVGAAGNKDFFAMDILPMRGIGYPRSYQGVNANEDHVDWESIMMYPSGAGGIDQGGTGPGNDNRLPVYEPVSGRDNPPILVPSSGDVAALRRMYSRQEPSSEFPPNIPILICDPRHPDYTDFQMLLDRCD